ncbi:acyl carrier protein [Kitasatospora sp. NBC_01250]|uniref:acyl carrier protein n=1 Tax=unclassified Kitasatospora TaxID=2633591 RepID=UPI002E0F3C7E|nr:MULTISPECIES: acyl carrier protein [unclassified Kitasatospora]WSJ68422.1 acyl carrier protein [Kitasatospora sp. NBC_01302]
MSTTQIVEKVIELLQVKYGYGTDEVTATTDFEELGFDSLVFVELAVALESDYGVPLSEAEVAETTTVQELAELIEAKTAGHPVTV